MADYNYSDVAVLGVGTLIFVLAVTIFAMPRAGKIFSAIPVFVVPLYAFTVPLPGPGKAASTDQLAHATAAGFLALMFTGLVVYFAMMFAIPLGETWQRRREARIRADFGLGPRSTP